MVHKKRTFQLGCLLIALLFLTSACAPVVAEQEPNGGNGEEPAAEPEQPEPEPTERGPEPVDEPQGFGEILPPGWVLPGGLDPANIVPFPAGEEQLRMQSELEAAMEETGINIEDFDTGLVAFDDGETAYVAPVRENFQKFSYNTIYGVYFDRSNSLDFGNIVYFLSTGEDDATVLFHFPDESQDPLVYDAFFEEQGELAPGTLIYFVRTNSHAKCVNFDSRAFCVRLPW